MKTFLLSLSALLCFSAYSQTITYPGNGKTSFGGAVGTGTISITDKGDSLSFKLTRGTGLFDSLLVFYIDEPTTTTGISSTANLSYSGTVDKYSVAASGRYSATQQAVLNFPVNFRPDLAIVFDKDGGKIYFLYEVFGVAVLQDQGSFTITPSGTNNAPTYTQTSSKTAYGLGPTDTLNFNFMGTYIGQTASRSNEAFGDPFTGYNRVESYNPYTVQSYFHFSSSLALPVSIVDISASKQQGKVAVKWTVAQEINIDQYELQRSANGREFSTIATIKGKNAEGINTYTAYDATPLNGNNYYRLRISERNGSKFSKVLMVNNTRAKSDFTINQLGTSLNIQLQDLKAGEYHLSVVNNSGQVLLTKKFSHDGVDAIKQIELTNSLKGIYRVVLFSEAFKISKTILLN